MSLANAFPLDLEWKLTILSKTLFLNLSRLKIFHYHHNHDDVGLDWRIGPHSDHGFLAVIVNDNDN